MTAVKICGLTEASAVDCVIKFKADFAGFVYYPKSPRHIELAKARMLATRLPKHIASVSVLVDPDDELLRQVYNVLQPAYVQLHGHEDASRITAIRAHFPNLKIIKAISVKNQEDVANASAFSGVADMLLFDAKAPEIPSSLPGGNGVTFDWGLLKNHEFSLPWMLSGGLNSANVANAVRQTGAKIIDVSSGVERAPGVKDPALIEAFVKAARSA